MKPSSRMTHSPVPNYSNHIDPAKKDYFSTLPAHVLQQCFINLNSILCIMNCSQVCKQWRDSVEANEMWKLICLKFRQDMIPVAVKNVQNTGGVSVAAIEGVLDDIWKANDNEQDWKQIFKNNYPIIRNIAREQVLMECRAAHIIRTNPNSGLYFNVISNLRFSDIADQLQLTFSLQLNRHPPVNMKSLKSGAAFFPSSCTLRLSPSDIPPNLQLKSLSSIAVRVISKRLMISRTIMFARGWELQKSVKPIWEPTPSNCPLQFHSMAATDHAGRQLHGCIITGTMAGSSQATSSSSSRSTAHVALFAILLHWMDILPSLLFDQPDSHPTNPRRQLTNNPNRAPLINRPGMVSMPRVSVELHSFTKMVFNSASMVAGTVEMEGGVPLLTAGWRAESKAPTMVLSFVSVPWKSAAFSGQLPFASMLTLTGCSPSGGVAFCFCVPVKFEAMADGGNDAFTGESSQMIGRVREGNGELTVVIWQGYRGIGMNIRLNRMAVFQSARNVA